MARYILIGEDDGEYSADASDYFWAAPQDELGALVRTDHEYRTTTGRTVTAPRLIKSEATKHDLDRLSPFVRRALARELPAADLTGHKAAVL